MAAASSSSFTISRLLSPPKASYLSATISSYSTRSSFSLLPLKLRPKKFPNHPTPTKPISNFSTTAAPKISPTISVGDKLPDSTLSYFNSANVLQTISVSSLTKSKKTILFAVPGAFTPTCSQKHLPGFIEKSEELKVKGIDTIACISVNDAFVMKAWKDDLGIQDEVLMLSDGNGAFTRAIGCELDLSEKPVGLGVRSRRYAMLVEDGVVKVLNLEQGGSFTFSGADDMLKLL